MKYTAILNGREREIEITKKDEFHFLVAIEGQVHEVDARYCATDWISLLIDNHSYDISFSREGDTIELNFWNHTFTVEVLDERKLRMKRIHTQLDHAGPELIKTSMPGKVIKVLVQEGDIVGPGTGMIIIEAMKMENEIQCRQGGKVTRVHVQGGQAVEADIPLIEISPDSD